MRASGHKGGSLAWLGLAIIALACFPVLLGGCGDDGSRKFIDQDLPDLGVTPPPEPEPPEPEPPEPEPPEPGDDTTPPTVSADLASGVYTSAQTVALSATDDQDPAPAIYYTTDGTYATTASTPYAGPIDIGASTILRFIAVDASANESEMGLEGYTIATFPIQQDWAESGHGHILGEPWRHWDEDGDVQTSCAKCHSTEGFPDWAMDGVVDAAAPLPVGLDCGACHQGAGTLYDDLATYPALAHVEFPSGALATLFNSSNMCMACHQGRSSTDDVDETIGADPGPYNFINIHYYAAAASYFGEEVRGFYQYAGMEYQERNVFPSHPQGLKDCVGCHMRGSADHTWEPQLSDCSGCHGGSSFETLGGSPGANHTDITTLEGDLLEVIMAYASGTIGTAIVYDITRYPYWFIDANGNGVRDPDEGDRYNLFDAALLRGAFNYHASQEEPCGYIHNGTYVQQVLHDSVVDLGGTPGVNPPGRPGFNGAAASETQQWQLSGHGHATAEAWRHWDEDDPPEISTGCAKCHSAPGFADFAADGTVDAPSPIIGMMDCVGCHVSPNLFGDTTTRYAAAGGAGPLVDVLYPSGVTQDLGNDSNMCAACHQGRSAGNLIDTATPNDVVQTPDYDSYNFINRHYFAAAAILYGTDVTAGYEYAGRTYMGQNMYPGAHGGAGYNTCVGCHMRGSADHRFVPQLTDCNTCHAGITDFEQLGNAFSPDVDYDGDGTAGSFQEEIDGMAAMLYAAMQTYATANLPTGIVYGAGSYPYFFIDTNGDGITDPDEASYANRYADFDLTLLRAAYNYHSAQDPCNDMHNYRYCLQTLYDSLDDLDDGMQNDSVAGATRP